MTRRSHALVASTLALISACSTQTAIVLPDGDFADVDAAGLFGRDGAVPPGLDAGPPPPGCEPEACDNGLDDDCDGRVDEDCPCLPGDTRSCYRGRAETRGHGLCRAGTMECTDGLEFGIWGDCVGDVVPSDEACDPAELDEDCDGAANEGCECTGSEPIPCGSDVGACGSGLQECLDGLRGDCLGSVGPAVEDCNGIDDDCDGSVDETLSRGCGSDVGECRRGRETCVGGAWDACSGGRASSDETCDGLDNDCDGAVDEGLLRECGSTLGECRPGTQSCTAGSWTECSGETLPGIELCDGLDNDCNGLVDDGLTRRCGSDLGVCTSGTEACTGGSWSACDGAIAPGTELCDGALDEDCDGTVDEGCDCVTGRTRACGTDVGACTAGAEACSTTGRWGACTGATSGTSETCNDVDDDCDGRVDEGLARGCGSDVGACRAGTETCASGAWGSCTGSIGPSAEVCEGVVDENCDGIVDEGCACTNGSTRPCGSSTGACRRGTETCASGAWGTCIGSIGPSTESCNGTDDDCDGRVDEGLSRSCGSDVGECRFGTETCAAGTWGSCLGGVLPSTEVCEGTRDENCDGTVDDGCTCVNGTTRPCGSDVGVCVAGTQSCVGGGWAACMGSTGPSAETCNGADDDCDGNVDEALTRTCGTDVGACSFGSQTCSTGSWSVCAGGIGPSAERCDGSIDENCDGRVDEGCDCVTGTTRSCGSSVGACRAGTETCDAAGRWGSCIGAIGASSEICDNVDNDCDSRVDESLSRSCGTDVGACTTGTQACSSGIWGSCTGGIGPTAELCDGSVDQNCDGRVDEGCACINGQTRPCGSSVGRCVPGTETCNLMGVWGSCTGGIGPIAESCNSVDDDCDSLVDESACTAPIVSCPMGMTAPVLSTVTLSGSGSDPDGGAVTYSWTVVSRPVGSISNPSAPTSATTNFYLDAAGTYTLELCVTDNEGERRCCRTDVVSTPPGVLHVELQWDRAWGDVDLHLLNVTRTPPDGWWTTDDCHFVYRSPDWGPAGAVANPTLDLDDVNGYGPENITITSSPQTGVYNIGVHYFCNRSAGGSGPISATVRVYCMGALVGTYTGITFSGTDEWVTVASIEWATCRARSVNTRTYGSSIYPSSFTATRHCEISCSGDSDCPPREYCATVGGGGPPRRACVLRP